ncbi:MAG: RNA polymerase sigma factor [Deltaproteobacteria bacterium]|nr:MAG: RNA polymerase sigma factor [Deltaproteobacteria bacterium]
MPRPSPATLEALRAGEPWALEQFYAEHARQVLGWAIRLGGPRLDPEDIAQDVFAIAFRRIHGFRADSQPSTWLYGITRNVIANARRRAAIRRWVGLDDVPELEERYEAGPDALVDARRRRRVVQEALDTLAPRYREVVVLCDLEGRSAPEAGELLQIPAGTVYSRLHYARKALANALDEQGLGRDELIGALAAGGGR